MKILRSVLESIASHARESRPLECCGILLAEGLASSTVTRALRADNAAENPRCRYVLGAKEHIRAVKMERDGVARIAGYYHSHPDGGCRPSRRDKDQAVGGIPYLIVGVDNGPAKYGLWRLEGDGLRTEPMEVRE